MLVVANCPLDDRTETEIWVLAVTLELVLVHLMQAPPKLLSAVRQFEIGTSDGLAALCSHTTEGWVGSLQTHNRGMGRWVGHDRWGKQRTAQWLHREIR